MMFVPSAIVWILWNSEIMCLRIFQTNGSAISDCRVLKYVDQIVSSELGLAQGSQENGFCVLSNSYFGNI